MRKILNRWYISLILLPILVNFISSSFKIADFVEDKKNTIIFTLLICFLILLYEYFLQKRRIANLTFKPRKNDKRIINGLLSKIDLNKIQVEIFEESCWYGYKKEIIHNLIEFSQEIGLIENETSDKKLNDKFRSLKNNIDAFNSAASSILYPDSEFFYTPCKSTQAQYDRTKSKYPEVDRLSKEMFEKIKEIREYLILKNYFE